MLFQPLRNLICSIHPQGHSLLCQVGFWSNSTLCSYRSRFIASRHSWWFVQGFPPWPPTLTYSRLSTHLTIPVRVLHPQNITTGNHRCGRWCSFHTTAGCLMERSGREREPLNKRRRSGDEKERKEKKEVHKGEGTKRTEVEDKSKWEQHHLGSRSNCSLESKQYVKDERWERVKNVSRENSRDKYVERTKTGNKDKPSKDSRAGTPNQHSQSAGSGVKIPPFRPEQNPTAVRQSNPWFRWKCPEEPSGHQRNIMGSEEQPRDEALQRYWEICSSEPQPPGDSTVFDFSVMSYNILSQDLLQDNSYLYQHCHPSVLPWDYRLPKLLAEIQQHNADILCLQEVQEDHYESQIKPTLQALGYQCEFKKRTGRKPDGCAIAFKTLRFSLLSSNPVEFFRPGNSLLDRDNVGLVVLLRPNNMTGQAGSSSFICVANTHLLYNPRRGDIKLAQLAILLAEINRLSRLPDGSTNPVVLCGDFNSVPWSPLYSFLTSGSLEYQGLQIGMVSGQEITSRGQRLLPSPIWPHSLGINHQCQYESIPTAEASTTISKAVEGAGSNTFTEELTSKDTPGFNRGRIEHGLKLQSSYGHHLPPDGRPEITTCHSRTALTVDYILYSSDFETTLSVPGGRGLQLLGRLSLVGQSELEGVNGLPNRCHPSDHLPLLAGFRFWR